MNDVSKNIRAFIYTTIDGNITFDSSNVPCYTKVPPDVRPPYITVRTGSMAPDHTKDTFGGIYQVIIEVVTRFKRNIGGQDDCDDISDSVMELLSPLGTYTSDFGQDTMWMFTGPEIRVIEETDDEYHYYIKELVFEAHVEQNDGHNINIDEILDRAPEPFAPGERANLYKVFNRMAESGNWDQLDMILILSLTSPANALWNWKTPENFVTKTSTKHYELPSSLATLLNASTDTSIKAKFRVLNGANGRFFQSDDNGHYSIRWSSGSGSTATVSGSANLWTHVIDGVNYGNEELTLDDVNSLINDGEWHIIETKNLVTTLWDNFFINKNSTDSCNIEMEYFHIDIGSDGIYEIRYDGYGRSLTGHDDLITTGLQPVAVNSPTHTPGKGYEMPTTEYINTNLIPSIDLINASEDDTHISTYIFENLDTASTKYFLGVEEAGVSRVFLGQVSGIRTALNGTDSVTTSPPNYLQSRTRYDLHRENSTGYTAYANNVEFINDPSNSIGVAQYPIYLGTLNYQGSPVNHIDLTASHFILGGGFDLTSLNTELDLLESLFIQSIQDQVINIFPNALSTTEETNVRSLVTQMIASGTWFNLENLWVLSMEDATNALYCWKTGTLATAVNGPSHTANQGYLFDGSTNYIDTNVEGADFRVASLDDIQVEGFVYENLDSGNGSLFGTLSTNLIEVIQDGDTGYLIWYANNALGSSNANEAVFADNSRYGVFREDSSNLSLRKNGTIVETDAKASVAIPTGQNIFIGARNTTSSTSFYLNARISYLSISNAQDPTSLDTDLDTLESLFVTYVAPSYSTEAQAVIDRMPNPMSTNEKNNIATVVDQMVNNGTWDETDEFFMFAMSDATNALTSWKTGLTATAVNGPTHTAGEGYLFDGSTNYLQSGITPSELTKASLDDIQVETFILENLQDGINDGHVFGVSDTLASNGSIYLHERPSSIRVQAYINSSSAINYTYGGDSAPNPLTENSRWGVSRSSGTYSINKDGVSVKSESETSEGPPEREIYIGALNSNGANTGDEWNGTLSHFWIGSAQASNLSTDLTLAETTFIS